MPSPQTSNNVAPSSSALAPASASNVTISVQDLKSALQALANIGNCVEKQLALLSTKVLALEIELLETAPQLAQTFDLLDKRMLLGPQTEADSRSCEHLERVGQQVEDMMVDLTINVEGLVVQLESVGEVLAELERAPNMISMVNQYWVDRINDVRDELMEQMVEGTTVAELHNGTANDSSGSLQEVDALQVGDSRGTR